jgi:hypothetical protein
MTCAVTVFGMPEFDGNRFVEVYKEWVLQYLVENATCPPKLPVAVASCYFAGSVFSRNVADTVSPTNFSSKPSEYSLPTTCTIFSSNFTVSLSVTTPNPSESASPLTSFVPSFPETSMTPSLSSTLSKPFESSRPSPSFPAILRTPRS